MTRESCRLPLGWTLRSPVPYGLRFRRPATASELTHYREASGNGFAPSINGTVKHENHQDHNAGSTADTIVMLALRNYQVGARLLVTYMHNLQTIAVSSLLAALDNLVAEHNAPWSEAECWSLDPHDEKDGQLIERWRGMDDRKTEVMIRQGLLSHVPWYRWQCGRTSRRPGGLTMADTQVWDWI
ncbi:hypothetical protein IAU59_004691 [Kwoniella sp. CBS 9459]